VIRKIGNFKEVIKESEEKFVLILKHSSTCSISTDAKNEINSFLMKNPTNNIYQVIVQNERQLSNEIADIFQIKHESPQLLLIKNGGVKKVLNHFQISLENIENLFQERTE